MRVSVLPNDDKDCGWINILPPLDPPTRLEGSQDADWVVLGAGFTGMAAARQLASHMPDRRIVLIDAQRAGQGASGRNAGFIIDLPHHVDSTDIEDQTVNHRTRRLNHAAIDWLRELVGTHNIACQWSERGKFHCAIENKGIAELQKFKRGLDALDEPYSALDAEALAARIGTRYYREGVHTPGNLLMQPAALARGLARWLPNSVELIEDSPVTEIEYGPVITLTTPGGRLRTANLILATNGFTRGLGFLENELLPIFATGSMTRPLDEAERAALGGEGDWGIIAGDKMGSTLRYTQDHRLFVRNTFVYNPKMYMTQSERDRMRRWHEKGFRSRFPMLPKVDFEFTWGGNICISRNHAPYFGKLADNVWAHVCQNGVGVAKGTIGGRLLADMIVGATSDLLDDMLAFPKPQKNPPRPFLDLAAMFMVNWEQRKAGRER
jgi:glycine/D-amino acid oxidase-like deaminating enzyme